MTDKELKIKYNEICNSLAARKLKPAFDLIEKWIQENNLGIYSDEYHNLEQTYQYMLKYTIEGIQDPERQKVYRKLIVSVFGLADRVYEALRMKYSTSVVYEKKRAFKNRYINDFEHYFSELEEFYLNNELKSLAGDKSAENTATPEEARKHQQKIIDAFYHIWFQDELKAREIEFMKNFISSELILTPYKSFLIGGLLMSLQRFYSEKKFSLLFDFYENDTAEVNQLALLGLLINFYRYDRRMPFYPDITGRLKILNENPEFKKNLETIILQLIRSKETEKIQKKIRDEIIPEMIKISPNLKDKIDLESLMERGLEDDKNPEWEEIFKDSPGLMDKMEEFSEMQMEGADVFMGSFSMLKMFPFFNELSHWFMPFFSENPEIDLVVDDSDETSRSFIKTIAHAPILCNSDKYSFC
ncbi:MAG: hypothetical protein ACOCVA_04260, partial [Prolixibacteraceae bacterium]